MPSAINPSSDGGDTTTTTTTTTENDDEALRKLLKPNPTNAQVLSALHQTYPDVSSIKIVKELDSYDDRNYCISFDTAATSGSGGGSSEEKKSHQQLLLLCKIYNGVESSKYIEATKSSSFSSDNNDDDGQNEPTQQQTNPPPPPPPLSPIQLYDAIFTHLSQPSYGITTSLPYQHHTFLPHSSSSCPHLQKGRSIHTLPVLSPKHPTQNLVIQLHHWVEGRTMASLTAPPPLYVMARAGVYLGRVCRALDDLTTFRQEGRRRRRRGSIEEAADRYHAWDGKNTLDLEKFLWCIEGEERRELVKSVLDGFRREFGEEKGEEQEEEEEGGVDVNGLRKGILMGDFNDANIIVDGGGGNDVVGVIDFCDSTYSWRVLDISVAMAYALLPPTTPPSHSLSYAASLLRGFHSVYPLTLPERRVLRLLISCRLACSVTLGALSIRGDPGNEYLKLHAEPAWRALGIVWGEDRWAEGIGKLFDLACDGGGGGGGDDGDGKNKVEERKKDGKSVIIDCTDIAFPDPNVVDVFHSVRRTE